MWLRHFYSFQVRKKYHVFTFHSLEFVSHDPELQKVETCQFENSTHHFVFNPLTVGAAYIQVFHFLLAH